MSTDDAKSNQVSIKKEPGSDNQPQQSSTSTIPLTTPIPVITTPIPVITTPIPVITTPIPVITTSNASVTKSTTPLINPAPINQQTSTANTQNKILIPPIKVITNNQIYVKNESPSTNLTSSSFSSSIPNKPPIAVNVSNNKTTSLSTNLNSNNTAPTNANQLLNKSATTNSFLSITPITRPPIAVITTTSTIPLVNKPPIAVIVSTNSSNLSSISSNNKTVSTAVLPAQTNQTTTTTTISSISLNNSNVTKESTTTNSATTTTTTTNNTAPLNSTAQINGETSSANDDKEKDKSSSVVVLNKQRLQELVAEIDTNEQLDEDVEDMLLNIADDFIDNLVSNACLLAKHRGSKNVEVKDVQLILEKNYNMYIAGFGSLPLNEEFKNVYKKSPATEAHKQRMALIKRALMKKF